MTTTETVTFDDVVEWLDDIASGTIDLTIDNQAMAKAAVSFLLQTEDSETYEATTFPPGYLSPNFTLEELTYSDTAIANGIINTPGKSETEQLTMLASITLEGIRTICGQEPMEISSGYRCPELNAEVGGASDSAHLYGCAADFTIPSFGTPTDICKILEPHMVELGIDQLIDECDSHGNRWVHVGRAVPPAEPRHECFALTA